MYDCYPALRPFKACLKCLPYFGDPDEAQDQELDDLLRGEQVKKTVKINGRNVAKRNNLTQRKVNIKGGNDPLAQLGFGIVAYIDILYSFACLFVFFSLLLTPTILAFMRHEGLDTREFKSYEKYMISNLGYSSVECEFIPISVGRITIQCPFGTVGRIFDYGVNNPDYGSPIDTCLNNNLV